MPEGESRSSAESKDFEPLTPELERIDLMERLRAMENFDDFLRLLSRKEPYVHLVLFIKEIRKKSVDFVVEGVRRMNSKIEKPVDVLQASTNVVEANHRFREVIKDAEEIDREVGQVLHEKIIELVAQEATNKLAENIIDDYRGSTPIKELGKKIK